MPFQTGREIEVKTKSALARDHDAFPSAPPNNRPGGLRCEKYGFAGRSDSGPGAAEPAHQVSPLVFAEYCFPDFVACFSWIGPGQSVCS